MSEEGIVLLQINIQNHPKPTNDFFEAPVKHIGIFHHGGFVYSTEPKIRTLWTKKNPNPNQPWNDHHHLIPWCHPQVVTVTTQKKLTTPQKNFRETLPGESSFQALQGVQGYWCHGAGRHALDRLRQLEVRRPRRRARRRRTGDAAAAAAASHAYAQRVAGGGVRWGGVEFLFLW